MNRNGLAILLVLALGSFGAAAVGQSPCPTSLQLTTAKKSGDLICLVPQVFGPGGMVGTNFGGPLDNTFGHAVHFQDSALSSFGPINSEIGVELSQLPVAAPVAGIVFENGVWTTSINFGPVLADRADTIGKHHAFLGASYQYFNFDRVGATNLRSFGAVLTHEAEPGVCGVQPNVDCSNGVPVYTNDIIATLNRVDLKVHQITVVGTYGLGKSFDASIAVPILQIRMNMNSQATIFNFEPPPVNHAFSPAAAASNPDETYIDLYDANFRNPGVKTGIGDVTVRAKYRAWQAASEKSAVAVGLEARLPTGDAYNFLGSGTWGIRPFLTYTHFSRLSPHATVGFQGNGNSVLSGDVTASPVTKAKLPDVFSYSAGGDMALGHHFSLSSDFFGLLLFNGAKIEPATFTDYAGGTHSTIAISTGNINELSVSVGGKIDLVQRLLLTGNVLFRVNDAGLHSKPVPLLGLSYSF